MINYPYMIYAKYDDGTGTFISGQNEQECIETAYYLEGKYGELTYYTGYTGMGYADGEYVGENEE